MELRNEIFAYVYDWLRQNNMVYGQQDLAAKTGINKNTITNILKGITSVSDKTLLKLNAGFDYMFNMQYLRGLDPTRMLIDDLVAESPNDMAPYTNNKQKQQEQTIEKINEIDPKDLMAGVENLLQIAATQIKDNEELRRELQSSILENQELSEKLQTSIQELQDVVRTLLSRPYPEVQQEFMKVAEKNNELTKNKKSDKSQK